jgi:hypothetical protein
MRAGRIGPFGRHEPEFASKSAILWNTDSRSVLGHPHPESIGTFAASRFIEITDDRDYHDLRKRNLDAG